MDTMQAFMNGEANRGKTDKVFDWDKALSVLHEMKAENAIAGLLEDMEWTSGEILRDGELVDDDYTYLASTWATPVLIVDGEVIECWCWDTEKDNPHHYDSKSKWETRHFKRWLELVGKNE